MIGLLTLGQAIAHRLLTFGEKIDSAEQAFSRIGGFYSYPPHMGNHGLLVHPILIENTRAVAYSFRGEILGACELLMLKLLFQPKALKSN